MKKSKLIAMLQEIPGDPEVTLWNGFVGDWQPLKTVESVELVKELRNFRESSINFQLKAEGKPPISQTEMDSVAKNMHWDLPNEFLEPELYSTWYGDKRKHLVVLEAGLRGKTAHDRLGRMEY